MRQSPSAVNAAPPSGANGVKPRVVLYRS